MKKNDVLVIQEKAKVELEKKTLSKYTPWLGNEQYLCFIIHTLPTDFNKNVTNI